MLSCEFDNFVGEREASDRCSGLCEAVEVVGSAKEELGIWGLSPFCGLFEHYCAGAKGDGDLLRRSAGRRLCCNAFFKVGAPSGEVIHPRFDGKEPVPNLIEQKSGLPKVVGKGGERDGAEFGFGRRAVENTAGDVVVTVGEDGCSHGDGITENSLCGIAACINLGLYLFDNDAATAFDGFHSTGFLFCFAISLNDHQVLYRDARSGGNVC